MSNAQLSVLFFLELAFILSVCRIVGMLAKKLGQPQVVAEMIAGVVMGPSLFGMLFPGLQHALFPKSAMSILYAASQVGLVFYMFLIGVEFDTSLIRRRLKSAAAVSLSGIITPFILGSLLALLLVGVPGLFGKSVVTWEAMLFMGAAMSITAFPMLARIILERGLAGTSLGTLALAAGSMDDAAAWCILALMLSIFNKDSAVALSAILGGAVYAGVILLVVKPLFTRLTPVVERHGNLNGPVLSLVLILLMVCAWITDTLGIYSIFGAFILGTAMPRGVFAYHLRKVLEPLVVSFLLPLFFVYSGLNTRLNLVNTLLLWGIALLILLAATFGKGIACWLAARLNKEPNREALAIGTLMNSRGLMELILLNIGLEKGVITPTLFTMLVLMAIVTTLIASPIFEFVYGRHRKDAAASSQKEENTVQGQQPLAERVLSL
ncbi:cation:proton antiporter domain-containing protein [Dictyobacter formicarum]|uniref:Potassium transporter n=1 Tax=Dictyobacter formicarum TaxID=2778368 RepID=A0ABQ3VW41_9CHLR|nr:cation:proton antiporter [Dictyobacter formicarum]GHO89516.1 potassium transporter [Dictyobacter formicarum]